MPTGTFSLTPRKRLCSSQNAVGEGRLHSTLSGIEHFMKISSLITLAFLLAGCESSRQSASLSAEQAATQAIRLANDKAFTLYHGRPFQPGQPAQFVAGHWIWSDRRGFGQGDIEASVELAVDGGPQKVEVTWFSNEQGFIQAGISIPTTNADLSPSVLMQFYFVGDRMNSRAYTRLPR